MVYICTCFALRENISGFKNRKKNVRLLSYLNKAIDIANFAKHVLNTILDIRSCLLNILTDFKNATLEYR